MNSGRLEGFGCHEVRCSEPVPKAPDKGQLGWWLDGPSYDDPRHVQGPLSCRPSPEARVRSTEPRGTRNQAARVTPDRTRPTRGKGYDVTTTKDTNNQYTGGTYVMIHK